MCGIAGWFNPAAVEPEPQRRMAAMRLAIKHRGPDDHGEFFDQTVGLGMQRLSIVDLEGGHQPMQSDDGALVIVYNGEIFNHALLRAEMRQRGIEFRTHCDTEVVLRLFETEGLAGLARLNGMFAIALWDRRQGRLHLVRDRMGVKPLYYAWNGRELIFGSEIKAILAGMAEKPAVNPRAVWDYLTYRFVPMEETIWQGIFKLPPAHHLTISRDRPEPTVQRWWDVPNLAKPDQKSDSELLDEFEALFHDAVDLRMLADVPVGILLSGGLDSSAVAASAVRGGGSVKTFSVAFADSPETDELPYARLAARHLGTDHHEIVIGAAEFQSFLPDLVYFTDEPLADLASVPLHYVCRLARGEVKVVLSGEGSDEILGGYTFDSWVKRWDAAQAALSVRQPSLLDRLLMRRAPTAPAAVDLRYAPDPLTMTNYMTGIEKKNLLLSSSGEWPDTLEGARSALSRFGPAAPLDQALYVYCQDWLVEDLLMKADRMSMAASLELRTPFLDYRMVELAARLPTRLKVGRNEAGVYETKVALRRLAAKLLPREIIERPKQGFPVPVYGWLSGPLAGWARESLLDSAARLRTWCDAQALERMVALGTAADAPMMDRHRLWNLLVLELWMVRWS
jgi:asparagine synthase (glutamine-hydrolysing)